MLVCVPSASIKSTKRWALSNILLMAFHERKIHFKTWTSFIFHTLSFLRFVLFLPLNLSAYKKTVPMHFTCNAAASAWAQKKMSLLWLCLVENLVFQKWISRFVANLGWWSSQIACGTSGTSCLLFHIFLYVETWFVYWIGFSAFELSGIMRR